MIGAWEGDENADRNAKTHKIVPSKAIEQNQEKCHGHENFTEGILNIRKDAVEISWQWEYGKVKRKAIEMAEIEI